MKTVHHFFKMYIFQFCCASLRCKLRIVLGNKWSNRRLFQKFITIRQRSCGKVIFWQGSVYHSVQGRSPCVRYPWCIGLHCAGFPCSGPIIDMEPPWLQPRPRHRTWDPSASEIWWPSLETCSNLFTWGPPPFWYWHLLATEEAHFEYAPQLGSGYHCDSAILL